MILSPSSTADTAMQWSRGQCIKHTQMQAAKHMLIHTLYNTHRADTAMQWPGGNRIKQTQSPVEKCMLINIILKLKQLCVLVNQYVQLCTKFRNFKCRLVKLIFMHIFTYNAFICLNKVQYLILCPKLNTVSLICRSKQPSIMCSFEILQAIFLLLIFVTSPVVLDKHEQLFDNANMLIVLALYHISSKKQ